MKAGLIILTLFVVNVTANAQMDKYFTKKGVALLAQCAHPSNTFQSGTFSIEDQFVLVDIYYQEGFHTRLKIYKDESSFTNIEVLEDNDFFPPFKFLGSMIKVLLEQENTDTATRDKVARELEEMLQRSIEKWTGADWSLLIINLDYLSF